MATSCPSHTCGTDAEAAKREEAAEELRLKEQLRRIQHKLLVMSGKGGVGKSSVATYMAFGLSQKGYRVGLMDADLHGPSIPKMLGITGMFQVDDQKHLVPVQVNENLQVVSIQCLLEDPDSAVIWRGPIKHGVIRQFVSEVQWGNLDYLIIDCPPGTGDEPLSVAQIIPDVHAVIVTTPQEVALSDVRKSINFCRKAHLPILGLVENMSGLVCPHCGKSVPLFGTEGGRKTAERMNIPFLGSLPFEPRVVEAGDAGMPLEVGSDASGPFLESLNGLLSEVIDKCSPPLPEEKTEAMTSDVTKEVPRMEKDNFKVAIPLANGMLCNHFGHCERFAILTVQNGRIESREERTPPPHEPGVLPRWIAEQGVNLVIAGGMGQRAISLFQERGVQVLTGAPALDPETLVNSYLQGNLVTGANVCDH
ncbi:Chromosome partitioning ATPase, Mrp family, contains Fe-S cluster [Desulfacinum hydrothermale DSM 13146]|uniref:Iron-sulfur cluster carrier protein n=1 Tax=Desulfacinum hydrothermale DSM 13146 TaxID=1121390 RepID=A0A1W1WY01_9BACT|nr:iron-sulfur cluster carrier protein MrpORP [Desulfacinum hydrothermale]SMC16473.1 Chromosome partitioning ATPase, Mrp family, contains Fe-S cluster [Desulfacinum hydrothermale DSM 13146]